MNKYVYTILTEFVAHVSESSCGYFSAQVVKKDTLHDRTTALEGLLKDELRECNWCAGTGLREVELVEWSGGCSELVYNDCYFCVGCGVSCASCNLDIDTCSCGGES